MSPTDSDRSSTPSRLEDLARDSKSSQEFATTNASVAATQCACLPTLYLSLSALQSMTDVSFPSSLHTLRETISSAWEALNCRECPKGFLTGFNNIQLLNTLLISLAERYAKVMLAINAETSRAQAAKESKTFRIDDMTAAKSHLHPVEAHLCSHPFGIELQPAEWSKLAKRVVRSEVYGTADNCCPGFLSLVVQMEERQIKWHYGPPPSDLPETYRRERLVSLQGGEEPGCVRMATSARRVVEELDYY